MPPSAKSTMLEPPSWIREPDPKAELLLSSVAPASSNTSWVVDSVGAIPAISVGVVDRVTPAVFWNREKSVNTPSILKTRMREKLWSGASVAPETEPNISKVRDWPDDSTNEVNMNDVRCSSTSSCSTMSRAVTVPAAERSHV